MYKNFVRCTPPSSKRKSAARGVRADSPPPRSRGVQKVIPTSAPVFYLDPTPVAYVVHFRRDYRNHIADYIPRGGLLPLYYTGMAAVHRPHIRDDRDLNFVCPTYI